MLKLDIAAAAEARKAKAQWAKENLDLHWPGDLDVWKDLARKYNVRLPSYTQPATSTKYVKRLFKEVNIDIQEYLEACGVKSIRTLAQMNPREPAFASVGFALEWIDEYKSGEMPEFEEEYGIYYRFSDKTHRFVI